MAAWNPGHIEVPDELIMPLYTAIGSLAVQWGNIEASLNLIIALLYHYAGGKEVQPELPRTALNRKLETLEKYAKKIDALTPFKADILAMSKAVTHQARIRNDVLHGYMSGYDPKTQRVCFTKLDPDEDTHIASNLHGTVEDLAVASVKATDLGVNIAGLMVRLQTAFWRENESN